MGFFNTYPYTDFHELNLDWIIKTIKDLDAVMKDFVALNKITWGGDWDISKSYTKWTIVDDGSGNGYLSIKAVPSGINLNNTNYWVQVTSYSALYTAFNSRITSLEATVGDASSGLVKDNTDNKADILNIQNDIGDIQNIISGLSLLSELTGATDTDKLNYAFDNYHGVILDKDIVVDEIDMVNNDFYLIGNGHSITVNGNIASSTAYGQQHRFYNCRFIGSATGKFTVGYNTLRDSYISCNFTGFSNNVFEGATLQELSFINCFFNNNGTCINISGRSDALVLENCFIENGNTNGIYLGYSFGTIIRDSTIEGLSGYAITFDDAIQDTLIDSCYFESNNENIKVRKDGLYNLTINNCRCDQTGKPNTWLLYVNSLTDGQMYGGITVTNSTFINSYIAKLNGSFSILIFTEYSNSSYIDVFDINSATISVGTIFSNVDKSKLASIAGKYDTGEQVLITSIEPSLYGRYIKSVQIMRVELSGSIQTTPQYYNVPFNSQYVYLNGDNTNTYTYYINFTY